MNPIIKNTADGSNTLYIQEIDEHYHSIHGAVQESKHVYINAGLNSVLNQNMESINILEIGFGTGLNCFLTLLENEKLETTIKYTAIEPFPLSNNLISNLNYAETKNQQEEIYFNKIHTCAWETINTISKKFTLVKIKQTLQQAEFDRSFNLIYFDAFGPKVQPEMWAETMFEKLFSFTDYCGILVTYCAKGEVKRILKRVGYDLESLPGPIGKREIIRAKKLK